MNKKKVKKEVIYEPVLKELKVYLKKKTEQEKDREISKYLANMYN